jgi:hypothetical protein
MLVPDAVGHHAARALEEPRSLEKFLSGLHHAGPYDFFPIELVGQRDNRPDRGGS